MTDYHTKPLLQARVNTESLAWARGEAERRGQPFGDFVDGLITAERAGGGGPVEVLRRIADQDIGGNAPWLADELHGFADRLAAEMRGECQWDGKEVTA